jgi:hypothetical protein
LQAQGQHGFNGFVSSGMSQDGGGG